MLAETSPAKFSLSIFVYSILTGKTKALRRRCSVEKKRCLVSFPDFCEKSKKMEGIYKKILRNFNKCFPSAILVKIKEIHRTPFEHPDEVLPPKNDDSICFSA